MPTRDDVLLGALAVRSGLLPAERYWALARELLDGPAERTLADLLVERGLATRDQVESMRRLGSHPLLTVAEAGVGGSHANAATIATARPTHATLVDGAVPPPAGAGKEMTIGKYRILGELGRGGMGVVYKALDPSTHRIVALKVLPPASGAREESVLRFQREVRTAASLRHPNIVAIHDVGSADEAHFFTMDYVEGRPLGERIAAGDLPVREALDVVRVISLALHSAHEQGIVHRDIKPSNILLDGRGTPYLTDFGLAKEIESSTRLTFSGQVMGTPSYMSPEQANGELDKLDGCSDVYSLGAVLYECLTQTPPFTDPSPAVVLYKTLHTDPEPVRKKNPRVHADVETICFKALQKERPQRYATAAALAEDLRRFLDGEPIVARPVGPAMRLVRLARKHRIAVAVVSIAFAATAGIAVHLRAEQERFEAERAGERESAERRRKADERTREALLQRGPARREGLAAALAIDPGYAPAHRAQAAEHAQRGDFAAAWRDLAEAARLAPEDDRTALALARFHEEVRGDLAAARAVLQGLMERTPSSPTGRLAAAADARLAGDTSTALERIGGLLNVAEVEATAHLEAALSHRAHGDVRAAAHAAQRALALEPDDPRPRRILADTSLFDLEYETALGHLDAYLAVVPLLAEPHLRRGWIHLASGDAAEAVADFDRAAQARENLADSLRRLAGPDGAPLQLAPDPCAADLLLWRAEASLAREDLARARTDLDALVRQHPRDARGWNALGRFHLRAGARDEARTCLDEALKLDPGLAEAVSQCAELATESERPALLARALALERAEGAPWARALVRGNEALVELEALLHSKVDRPVKALPAARAYREALLHDPRSSNARLGLARVRLGLLDPRGAGEELDRALAANPLNPDVWLLRGLVARDYPVLALGARAAEDFRRAAELDPGDAEVWFCWAYHLDQSGDTEGAIRHYDRAIALDPNLAAAYARRSECHLAAGRSEEAERDFVTWRRLPTRDAIAHRYWGFAEAYEEEHDYARAVWFYDQAVYWNWKGAYLYGSRARVFQRKNQLGDYVLDLARTLELEPQEDAKKYTDFWTLRTKLPFLLSLAIREVEKLAPQRAHEPAAQFALGFVSLLSGNMKRAVESFDRAIARNPDFLTARTLRAFCLHRTGRREEGRAELNEVLEKHPNKALVRYFLACLEAADGRGEEALKTLEQAVGEGFYATEVAATQGEFKALRDDPRFQRILRSK